MVIETIAFAVVMISLVRPMATRWATEHLRRHQGQLTLNGLAVLIVAILVAATITNVIGIFSIFGAFFFGAILYDQGEFRVAVQERLRDFVTAFFLPIFFTYTGLRTDIGTMSGAAMWAMCAMVLTTAIVGKFGGCSLAARANGLPWREATMIGVLMNTRALMELIVVNIGFDLGVIPKSVFFMLVFMAVFTTYMTTPLLRRLVRSSELESHYIRSDFAAHVEARSRACPRPESTWST
jgi:Kef-type K+ transport system membrane component KefB